MANESPDAKNGCVTDRQTASNDAFGHLMIGVLTRCRDLATAIDNHDFEAVQFIARDAANMWLAGRAACRRVLGSVKQPSPIAESARRLLEQRYMDVLALFSEASSTIAVPTMVKTLRELRDTLTTANAHPLVS